MCIELKPERGVTVDIARKWINAQKRDAVTIWQFHPLNFADFLLTASSCYSWTIGIRSATTRLGGD
jgi:hypothetical protein